jgi:hypothetical protein
MKLRIYIWHGRLRGTHKHAATHTRETAVNADINTLANVWGAYGHYAIIGSLGIALALIVTTIRRVTRRTTTTKHDHLSNIVTAMALALTAEGMFWVLTSKLSMPLPWWLAIFVCAVAEGLMVNFFRLAKEFQQKHGRPGPFGTAFWIVAVAEGAIVALASTNVVEIALRILLPLGVALLHWIKLTAESSQENRGRFVWTPLNLLIRLGAWKPGKTTVDEDEAKRFEEKLTRAAYMLASARIGKQRKLRRVRRMMLQADPATAEAVIAHLELAYGIEARIMAVTTTGATAVRVASGTTTTVGALPTAPANGRPTTNPTATPINGHQHNGHQPAIASGPARRTMTAFMTTAERDTDIVVRYWDALTELVQAGTLCRSAIERACTVGDDKVLARQAKRILDIVTCAHTLDAGTPVADRVAQAIEMIAAGQN